jgi:hypothetical protein
VLAHLPISSSVLSRSLTISLAAGLSKAQLPVSPVHSEVLLQMLALRSVAPPPPQLGGVSDETVRYVMGPARLGPLSDSTANYRPVLSSEMAPHFKNQEIVRLKERKWKIWPWAAKEGPTDCTITSAGHKWNQMSGGITGLFGPWGK